MTDVAAATAKAPVAGADWPRFGGDTTETHYSPLKQIDARNIARLGLAWYQDLPAAPGSGVSAPVAADGVLYFAIGLSVIRAVDARSGRTLWEYDPKVPDVAGHKLRAGWGVRGIAYASGKVLTGTLDGRLIALDAKSGRLLWSAMTVDPKDERYITGPPYVMNGKVVIGHGGGDYGPVRGYVTAYDLDTGRQAWRFYTVPGNPAEAFENEAMRMAAKTWTGEWWKRGGGGTAWHAMAYDAELKRIYIGTGNGAPWNQKIRSPGGGDNLFVCSIVALDADTGEYIWHYQINPGETWDFNAAMDIQLADLTIGGQLRKTILHAPKNGFFYVIDRTNGKLISAEPFARQNWAERIDLASGRPVERPEARFPTGTAYLLFPAAWGAHGVEAMSFNPQTGLVYLPARDRGNVYTDAPNVATWEHRRIMVIDNGLGAAPAGMSAPEPKGWLAAWDPLRQKEVWRVDIDHSHGGGTLTTAGDIVMHGRASGELAVYAARTGRKLWSFDARNGIMAHPISYLAGGRQQISLLVGWRGSDTIPPKRLRWPYRTQERRLLTFTLDGRAKLPSGPRAAEGPILDDERFVPEPAKAQLGRAVYTRNCFVCHGGGLYAAGSAPDLLRSGLALNAAALAEVVQKGSLRAQGMPQYEEMPDTEVEALVHYIRSVARERLAADTRGAAR